MKTLTTTAIAGLLLSLASGCGVAVTPTSRLVVHQQSAAITIEGRGTVEGGAISCGPEATGTCAGAFEDVWATVLEARAALGWRFAGWQRGARNPSLGSSVERDETIVYTATFERETARSVAGNMPAGR